MKTDERLEARDESQSEEIIAITVNVGPMLFEFQTFTDWVNRARRKFEKCGVRSEDVICVDTYGRLCSVGKQFMRARDENTFPIKVYQKVIE